MTFLAITKMQGTNMFVWVFFFPQIYTYIFIYIYKVKSLDSSYALSLTVDPDW